MAVDAFHGRCTFSKSFGRGVASVVGNQLAPRGSMNLIEWRADVSGHGSYIWGSIIGRIGAWQLRRLFGDENATTWNVWESLFRIGIQRIEFFQRVIRRTAHGPHRSRGTIQFHRSRFGLPCVFREFEALRDLSIRASIRQRFFSAKGFAGFPVDASHEKII